MKQILLIIAFIFSICFGQVKTVQDVMNEVLDDDNDALQVNVVEHFAKDADLDAIIVIDAFHHKIHEGEHFNVGGSFSLSSSDTSLIVFDVADTTKYSHILWNLSSTVGATVVISSGGVIAESANGLTINNNNMNSEAESVMDTVYVINHGTNAVTRYGTTLRTHTLGALQKSGGELGREGEWILKSDSLFVIKVTANAGSEVFDFIFEWYEHEL